MIQSNIRYWHFLSSKKPVIRLGRLSFLIGLLLFSHLIFLSQTVYSSGVPHKSKAESTGYVEGEVLVKFKKGVSEDVIRGLHGQVGQETGVIPKFNLRRVKVKQGMSVEDAIAKYSNNPLVDYVEPNYVLHADVFPNDPSFPELWGLHNTGQMVDWTWGTYDADTDAPEAWDITTGNSNIVIAVTDTGVAYDHPDLSANIWTNPGEIPGNGMDDDNNGYLDDTVGWDFFQNDNDPMDYNGHGTHVAGTIGAVGNNGIGITGVLWDIRIMPLRFLDGAGYGSTFDAVNAILYAADNGARVINASWGGDSYSQSLYNAVSYAGGLGVLFVAAAGNESADNDNPATPSYPANFSITHSNVISVAATDQNDDLSLFSNFGLSSVNVAAPGENIYSTVPARIVVWDDNFDTGNMTGWTTDGANNTWDVTQNKSLSPQYSLTDSPSGNYLPNTNSWAYTPAIDLTGEEGCVLSFNMDIDTPFPTEDYLYVEGSTDSVNWPNLVRIGGTTQGYFVPFDVDITTYDNQPSTYIRFRLESDAANNNDGVYIDDVTIKCRDFVYWGNEYEYLMGTSMATPHVAGLAGLIWGTNPSLDYLTVKNAILNGVDHLTSLQGKVSTGGRINAYNSLQQPQATVEIPRTGQMTCYNTNGSLIPCSWTGQDGAIRAGIPWPDPRFTDNNDETVTDNLTGLIWTKNANLPGAPTTWQQALDYVAGMNQGIYPNFGHTDWRLPNINELDSLVDAEKTIMILPGGNPFVNVQNGGYWSSTTYAWVSGSAWLVHMYGAEQAYGKTSYDASIYVWPVRSGQSGEIQLPRTGQTICYDTNGSVIPCAGTGQDGDTQIGVSWPGQRFTDNNDGTVNDNLTNLMWTKDANLPWGVVTWQQSLDYIAGMNAGVNPNFGYTDWRLPNWRELQSLVDRNQYNPALPSGHPFVIGGYTWNAGGIVFWSSTTYMGDSYTTSTWYMRIGDGFLNGGSDKSWYAFVWPVRGGYVGPDPDNDGIPDVSDNCPSDYNPGQNNNDLDSLGDVCDHDDDNDGYTDDAEVAAGSDPFNAASTPEICDYTDNDLDGLIDEGVLNTYYRDVDNDTYGDASVITQACTPPAGYVTNSTDCNDGNASINPGVTELCNGIDDNCNTQVDESCPIVEVCDGIDNDGDGFIDEGFPDTDGDSQADCVDTDDDGDGMSDGWEVQYGLNPLDPLDGSYDTDFDGFTNYQEYIAGTNPQDANSKPSSKLIYEWTGGTNIIGLHQVADVDSDGKVEVLFNTADALMALENISDNNYGIIFNSGTGGIWCPGCNLQIMDGDIDQDGKLEYILHDASSVSVFETTGNNSFIQTYTKGISSEIDSMVADEVDLDGDGLRELLVGIPNQNLFLEYDGVSNTLIESLNLPRSVYNGGPETTFDFDGDGRSEILIKGNVGCCAVPFYFQILKNTGNNSYQSVYELSSTSLVTGGNYRNAAGDLDGDGLGEFYVMSDSNGFDQSGGNLKWQIMEKVPGSGFSFQPVFEVSGDGFFIMTDSGMDLNGNGKKEFVLINMASPFFGVQPPAVSKIQVYENDGDNNYKIIFDSTGTNLPIGGALYRDTDQDGIPELIIGLEDRLQIWEFSSNAGSTPEVCDGIDNDLDSFIDEGFPDTDSDGAADCVDMDDDNDGMSDSWEGLYGLNPIDPGDAGLDGDGDGFTNLEEYIGQTDPGNFVEVPAYQTVLDGSMQPIRLVAPPDATVTSFSWIDPATLPPTAESFPYGLVSIILNVPIPGASATVALTFPGTVNTANIYKKYGPTSLDPTYHWYDFSFGSNDGDALITLTLTDGGAGDHDLVANGVIDDPGGPSLPTEVLISSATGNQQSQTVAWNSVDKEYLVLWQDFRNGSANPNIYGARLDINGSVVATDLPIVTQTAKQAGPWVAYGGGGYLAVWIDQRNMSTTGTDVYGAWILPDGTVSSEFVVTNAPSNQRAASVIYNPSANNFLVTWIDETNGISNIDVWGAIVNPGGGVSSGPFAMVTATGNQRGPYARYDYGTSQYFMVWFDNRGGNYDIYGSRVSSSGALLDGSGLVISNAAGDQKNGRMTDRRPADGINNFVLSWIDFRNGQPDIYGAIVDGTGTKIGSDVAISTGSWEERAASIDVDYVRTKQAVVSWIDNRNGTDFDIYRAQVDQSGVVSGEALVAGAGTGAANNQQGPLSFYTADGGVDNGFLMLWRDNRSGVDYDLYGIKVWP